MYPNTSQSNTRIKGGLLALPPDSRDFALGALFSHAKVSEVPEHSFIVATPLFMKNQKDSDLCTGYTITSVSEDQEGLELSPHFQFAMTKKKKGSIDEWGADLRTACKSATDPGSIPHNEALKYLKEKGINPENRDEVANWENWSPSLSSLANKYRKQSFFSLENINAKDTFDKIRVALWTHRLERRTIAVGALWRESWTNARMGVIPTQYEEQGFGHAFKIFGQKLIDGEMHLMAQLSNGTDIGDYGIFYFPRVVVNREFNYGQFMFKDIDPDQAKDYMKRGIKFDDSFLVQIIKLFLGKIGLWHH